MWNRELARDKMITTENEKDLAGANVTTKAAQIKEEEGYVLFV